jgi:hypothetical protein
MLLGGRMSTTDLTTPSTLERSRAIGSVRVGETVVPWARVALACALLVAAGAARWWQGERVQEVLAEGGQPPFPLKNLPMSLGGWHVPDQREETLEPAIQAVLNSADALKRHYVDERTGVVVEVLLLYGPSTIAHFPEVCYPGAGYKLVDGPSQRKLVVAGQTAVFNSLVFAKGEGGVVDRQHVLYALRYEDRWTTAANFRKLPRLAGLYKLQLTRRVGTRERLDVANPCEALLAALLPELERLWRESRVEREK